VEFERQTHSTTNPVNPVQLRAFIDLQMVKYLPKGASR
jgi:hypothetical protein